MGKEGEDREWLRKKNKGIAVLIFIHVDRMQGLFEVSMVFYAKRLDQPTVILFETPKSLPVGGY